MTSHVDSPVVTTAGAQRSRVTTSTGRVRIRSVISFGAAESVARASNWITLAVLPLLLDPFEYGIVGLIVAAEALLLTVILVGQDRAILRFDGIEGNSKVLGSSFVAPAIAFVAVAISLATYGLFQPDLFGIPQTPHLPLLLAALALLVVNSLRMAKARSDGDLRMFILFRPTVAVLKLGLTIGLTVLVPLSQSYLYALIASLVVVTVFSLVRSDFSVSRFSASSATARRLFAFGWPFILHAISGNVLVAADRFMLEAYVNESVVGHYTLAYTVGFFILFVFGAVSTYMEPQIYQRSGDTHASEGLIGHYMFVCTFLALLVGAFGVASFDLLAVPVFGEEYASSRGLVPIVLAAYLLFPSYNQGNYRLTIAQKTRVVALASALAGVSNIILNIWLIPRFGAEGAAYATLLSYAMLALVTLGFSLWQSGVTWDAVRARSVIVISFGVAFGIALVPTPLASATILLAGAGLVLVANMKYTARYVGMVYSRLRR